MENKYLVVLIKNSLANTIGVNNAFYILSYCRDKKLNFLKKKYLLKTLLLVKTN